MSQLQACPSDDELACFIDGQTTSAAAESIRNHVDMCESCRQLIANTLRAEATPHSFHPGALAARTFAAGELLNRRFRILRFIAKGGMGEVYEARDIQLGETVALKTIVCTGLDNARLFPRLRAEVQMARRVTHPNVCRILEFGTTEPRAPGLEVVPYFTMEYLHGSTLKEYLNQRGRLPLVEVVTLATQILDGLAAVHAAGIVHRDLKTENVYLVPQSAGALRAVVMDFGLARSMITQDSGSGLSGDALVGTPAYMAPEQILGGEPTAAWDIFSLGVVVFELLSGSLPFSGKTALATAMARIRESAPPLSASVPEIHPELEEVVARCLQVDPRRRFSSAIAARDAFVRIQHVRRVAEHRRGKRLLRIGRGLGLASVTALLGFSCHRLIVPNTKSPGGVVERDSLGYASAPRALTTRGVAVSSTARNSNAAASPVAASPVAASPVAASPVAPTRDPVRGAVRMSNKTMQRPTVAPPVATNAPSPSGQTRQAEGLSVARPPARVEVADDLAVPEFARRQRPMRIGAL